MLILTSPHFEEHTPPPGHPESPERARVLATELEGLNARRKLLCDQVYRAAEAQLRDDPSLLAHPVIVLAHPAWPMAEPDGQRLADFVQACCRAQRPARAEVQAQAEAQAG